MQCVSIQEMRFTVEFPGDPSRAKLPDTAARRDLRIGASLTLWYAGWMIGVSAATLSRWERGIVEPIGTKRLVYAALLRHLADSGANAARKNKGDGDV